MVSPQQNLPGTVQGLGDRGIREPAAPVSTPQEPIAMTTPAVYLQPIAAPSILGLYGFAGATFMVAANMCHWYGTANSPLILFPFAAVFGGLAQFAAGMWSYKARDGVATAMHGMWGAFWMAWGILWLLIAVGKMAAPSGASPELAFWFCVLAAITWMGMFAAMAENMALASVLGFLAAGSTLAAIFWFTDRRGWETAAGYCFIVSAILAFYTASALMLKGAYNRPVLNLFEVHRPMLPVNFGAGEPGVKKGQ